MKIFYSLLFLLCFNAHCQDTLTVSLSSNISIDNSNAKVVLNPLSEQIKKELAEVTTINVYAPLNKSHEISFEIGTEHFFECVNKLNITPTALALLNEHIYTKKDNSSFNDKRQDKSYIQIVYSTKEPKIEESHTINKTLVVIDSANTETGAEIRKWMYGPPKPLTLEEAYALKKDYQLNIEFTRGSYKIRNESKPELVYLADFLKDTPDAKILIRGHICCVNKKKYSKKRAKAVRDQLVKLGVNKKQLEYIGMSNSEPLIWPEVTEEDRKKNRRVDMQFLR